MFFFFLLIGEKRTGLGKGSLMGVKDEQGRERDMRVHGGTTAKAIVAPDVGWVESWG